LVGHRSATRNETTSAAFVSSLVRN
jgi:hypothetical protein